MSVAGGKNNYEPKFQLSSSNNLGDMLFFWLKLRIKKGTLFIIFLMKTYLLLKLPKSRERVKQNFLSLKKFIENQFFEVVLSRHKKRFRVDWAILIFYENFSEIVNLDFEFFLCQNSGHRKIFKNLFFQKNQIFNIGIFGCIRKFRIFWAIFVFAKKKYNLLYIIN